MHSPRITTGVIDQLQDHLSIIKSLRTVTPYKSHHKKLDELEDEILELLNWLGDIRSVADEVTVYTVKFQHKQLTKIANSVGYKF